jgi:hypothetical protein
MSWLLVALGPSGRLHQRGHYWQNVINFISLRCCYVAMLRPSYGNLHTVSEATQRN